ncbi:MAG: folylpolyglutamate synthase/dihydrofolate synthase family protein [Raineya sp.]
MFQQVGGVAFKAGLERISALCEALGKPQKKFRSIHIAGTNGKGSSSHYLAAICQEMGYNTGLTTSPHLKSFTERIKINGENIAQEDLASFVTQNQKLIEETEASFFEVMIAMAFWYFAEKNVDIAIVETGLGGRLDATNIIEPLACLITNIGYDHQQFLGDTLEKIATEKAGIIKPQTPVIIGEKHPETQPVFVQKAQEKNAPLYFAQDYWQVLESKREQDFLNLQIQHISTKETLLFQSALQGSYQQKNILGVLQTLQVLNKTQSLFTSKASWQEGCKNVVQNTGLKGRWQILQNSPLIIADTAHNPNGIAEVVEQIRTIGYQKLHLVLGFMKDKDVEKILQLYPQEAQFYFCKPNLERAMPLEQIARIATNLNLSFELIEDTNEALTKAKTMASAQDLVFVGGSTFVVAEIYGL